MAGKVTVRAELERGQVYELEAKWNGGNPRWEAEEFERAVARAVENVSKAIVAVNGDVRKDAK